MQWLKSLDKTLVASIVLHVAVIGWGIISFSARSLEAKPQESLPVDIISAEKFSEITKGMKNGDKTVPKPMAEKVADAKPVDDAVGKISEKKEVITPTAEQQPQPKPQEKPVEKKPDPPKPVAQEKPKEQPKPAEKKDDQKIDPIAEQLKKDQTKPQPKPDAKATPQPPKPKERVFDQAKIAALLDKRDPTRQSITGSELNPNSALGTSAGAAQKLTLSWVGALQQRISQCWVVPGGVRDAEDIHVRIAFDLNRNGTLVARPILLEGPPTTFGPAIAESAIRAVEQCQPYSFLPPSEYKGGWDKIDITFSTKEMFHR
jgi:colicin import membrane protein